MEPQIQYARSADGTSIAFYDTGDGVPIVISPNLWSGLAASWEGEAGEASTRLVEEGCRLIRYDMRGMGLSDRDVSDFSLDAQVSDIEALADHLRLERFVLFGIVFGTPPSIAYAARYPDRLTQLVLHVPFADGEAWYRGQPTLQGLESFRALGNEQWRLYIKTHATALAGMLNLADADEISDHMMKSASPASLSRCLRALRQINITDLLQYVRTPTLAFNTGTEFDVPFARRVVAGIPGARLVPAARATSPFVVPSPNQVPEIVRFVFGREPSAVPPERVGEAGPHGTVVVLIADIADSTALTERLGDAAFRAKARDLDAVLRDRVRANGGSVIDAKTLGDGILATFPAASQAISAALLLEPAANAFGLGLHVGLHAGDVIHEQENVFGGAVNVAARISGLSPPGQVLVSDVVRALARTSASVQFEDLGEHELKGVTEAQRLYAVRRPG